MRIIIFFIFSILFNINTYSAPATMYVTPDGAGAKDGTGWSDAFNLTNFETDFENSVEAGDTYYVADGTYTLTNSFSTARDGSSTATANIIGVINGTTDYAYGDDRPLFACGSYEFKVDRDWDIRNLRFTISSALGVQNHVGSLYKNCKSVNSGSSGSRAYLIGYTSGYGKILESEAVSTNGVGIQLDNNGLVLGCYIHDSVDGINLNGEGSSSMINSLIETISDQAIDLGNAGDYRIYGNTIFSATDGIKGTTGVWGLSVNNIISNCTTGANFSQNTEDSYWDYNLWSGNTVDVVNVTKGINSINGTAVFSSSESANFTVSSSSDALDSGLQIDTNVGAIGDYKVNIGVDQSDHSSGSTPTTKSYGFAQ